MKIPSDFGGRFLALRTRYPSGLISEEGVGENYVKPKETSALDLLREKMKRKELKAVDHSAVDYAPFRKRFYIVPREVAAMSSAHGHARLTSSRAISDAMYAKNAYD